LFAECLQARVKRSKSAKKRPFPEKPAVQRKKCVEQNASQKCIDSPIFHKSAFFQACMVFLARLQTLGKQHICRAPQQSGP